MRLVISVREPERNWARDYVLDAEPETSLGDIGKALAQQLGSRGSPGAIYLGSTPLDPGRTLGGSGIYDGAILSVNAPLGGRGDRPGLVSVRTVAGPDAGNVVTVAAGVSTIGTDPQCTVRLEAGLPPVAAELLVDLDAGVTVRATTDAPLQLNRAPLLATPTPWRAGAQLRAGRSVLEVSPVLPPDAVIEPSGEGEWLDYNRPPRMLPPQRQHAFRLPAPPQPFQRSPMPWITAALPALAGVVMAFAMQQPAYLLMACMSPLMMIGSTMSSRRTGKQSYRHMLAEHQQRIAAVETEIAAALDTEVLDRRRAAPDAAQLLVTATDPRSRLWERRRTDPDHLLLRVGTADLVSDIQVEDMSQTDQHRRAPRATPDVPVALSLAAAGIVGVAGRGDWPRMTARWLVGQLAVLQSPRDVQLYLLTDQQGGRWWEWARWLPHVRPALGQSALTLIGVDADTLGRRVAELSQLITARNKARLDARPGLRSSEPDVVVVLDGARRLRAIPGVVALLQEGPSVGIYCLCLDSDERTLPEECAAVVVEAPDASLTLKQQRALDITGVRPDEVAQPWFDRVGRALSPLRDVSDTDGESALPGAARLLELLGLEQPDAGAITARWALLGRATRAIIGVSLDGPFAIDLVDDGPHGLVAGTTGAGKSEFLQSLVASFAVANRPDAMTFVLIDYKGGAAFKDCVQLPHTVGMVTDLDPHLVQRALTSLGAELTHREHLLADAGAKDLEDYLDYASRRADLPPIPRLVIVIDEFASLFRELPEFVSGLVNVAQRGRSLGIHLVLATQRPSGVVSSEIRANTNLRVALRVTDAGESSDVIDAPDAAGISKATPGRAYVRLGHTSLLPFQTGRVGGRRPAAAQQVAIRAPFVYPLSWTDLGRPVPEPRQAAADTLVATDLSVLVAAIRAANDQAGIAPQRRPWLPPLPSAYVITPDESRAVPGAASIPPFTWAMQDRPAEQAQRPVAIDLAEFGHLYIVGAPQSGRSQALRTIAAAVAGVASCADVHLFGIDCGNGALLPLSRFPHCGAVVQRSQTDRAARLIGRLRDETLRRQQVLGDGGFANITEQRHATDADTRLPHLIVLLDRWEGFTGSLGEYDSGALTDQIHTLLREGASVGVHVVITGDHTLLSGRMSALCDEKLVLRLTDRSDYSLAGLNHRTIAADIPPGRGYRSPGGTETQIALLCEDPSGPAQVGALTEFAQRLRDRDAGVPRGRRPMQVAVLPATLTVDQAWDFAGPDADGPMWAMVGVGGDDLVAIGADLLTDQRTFLVAGPARSGRSTVLCVMADSLLRHGCELVVAAPAASPLRDFAARPGVRAVLTDAEVSEDVLAPLMEPGDKHVVLVIDDGELLRDAPCKDWLRGFVRTSSGDGRGLILGGNAAEVGGGFTGWQADVKKNRRGALLSPQNATDGDLVGVRIARSSLASQVVPGRAMVYLGTGELITVQVPTMQVPTMGQGA